MSLPLEICAYSLESCIAAQKAGAARVELCASAKEGGITPSIGMIQQARKILNQTKSTLLFVMIRPRGGDFLYSDIEFEQMISDAIEAVRSGADGLVLGILKRDGSIDINRSKQIIETARSAYKEIISEQKELGITFHRAFDRADVFAEVEGIKLPNNKKIKDRISEVIQTGADRILTSGFMPTAEEGINNLRLIVNIRDNIREEKGDDISIMAGSGIYSGNVKELLSCGIDELHATAKSIRRGEMKYCSPYFNSPDETEITYSDIRKILSIQKENI